jgi:predicted glycosyltransferase
MRAQLFQEKGLIDVLDPQEVSPKNLAQRISENLERTDFPLPDAAIDMSGARNAAGRLSELLRERAGVLPMTLSTTPVAGALGAKRAAAR